MGVYSSGVSAISGGKLQRAAGITGQVLQTVSTIKTTVFSASIAGGAYTDITGLAASITPSSSSSKIWLMASVSFSINQPALMIRATRAGTVIAVGDAAGSRRQGATPAMSTTGDTNRGVHGTINYLDSPGTTSSITYQIQLGLAEPSGSATCYCNTSGTDADAGYTVRAVSTVTLMEIAA